MTTIVISYTDGEPALSNLMPYGFEFDGVACASMEGFLQSLKWAQREKAKEFAAMYGVEAWKKGQAGNDWKLDQILYWNNTAFHRLSKAYQTLLTRAFDACFAANPAFRVALLKSGNATLTHNGKYNASNTVLTVTEYLFQLYRLRAEAHQSWEGISE